ncbi:endolytic transglycosylase MltG [Bosea sp. (in: a-proteobacteria)]|uniref:endolytic transglycosylase MltG n=1 Tax=Bosea sp. (in: a-proteobacteria) TaxID=1871050 RepID=UPI0027375E65|nr:endolytic transglycosylase MltG [Bosea sp. (in: a-proteobacteria)]MDP3409573.1 endolytic transglycosylase MltG [Bosea sp. (in: a-proteobacteria)]
MNQSPRVAPKSPSEALKPVAPPAPPPKARRRRRSSPFIAMMSGLFTALLVIGGLMGAGIAMVGSQSRAPGPLASDRVLIIPKDSGLTDIADLLQREGMIDHPWSFRISALVSGNWTKLKAGEYLFKARASQAEILDIIADGKVVEHSITVPEGLTSEQIVARLRENELLTGDIIQVPREGSILPDTYRIPRGFSRQAIIDRMTRDQRAVLARIWERRPADLPIKTPQELVVLASIVEKETGRADERPRVAGVFINRLNRKMRLQSDPTIVYGLVGGKGTLGRSILRTEITQPTPYNTYVIDGLPPGPIANPGRAAMEAVVAHSRTKDLYFVADGSGGHAFGETLEQHNRNVARWRQIEAARRDPGKPPAEASVDKVEPPAAPDTRSEAPAQQPADSGAIETWPVPGNRRAGAGPQQQGAALAGGVRARAFDASEGTPRDPLLNKTFDLNSPKAIPALRP